MKIAKRRALMSHADCRLAPCESFSWSIPGAELKEDQRGAYLEIPVSALKTFKKPKIGRPKKSKDD